MGRTRPTYRRMLEKERQEYEPMRRWLRKQYKSDYDSLWVHAEDFADAAGEANRADPMEAILVSICLGQQYEIGMLQTRIQELEASG